MSRRSFRVESLEDVSTGAVRRHRADIVIDQESRASQIESMRHALRHAQRKQVYQNEQSRQRWAPRWQPGVLRHPVDVVFLFIYRSEEDIPAAQWIARCQWISPDLEETFHPGKIRADDMVDGMTIEWRAP